MAPSIESFQDHLYKHRAVYVDSLSEMATKLSLLDVLVKIDSESAGWLSKPYPVLLDCGSMKDVGTYSRPEDQQLLHGGLEEFDKCTREGLAATYDQNLFNWEVAPGNVIDCKLSSAANLKSSLQSAGFAEAEFHFLNSSTLQIHIEGMETACVKDTRRIAHLVKNKLWKPIPVALNMASQTYIPALLGRKTHKVWVVHQLLFASQLTVTSTASASVGAKLICHVVPGTPGGELNFVQCPDERNTIKLSDPRIGLKYPGKILFAFRALCFRFNGAGECVGMEVDAGAVRPILREYVGYPLAVRPKVRAEEDNPSHEQERAQISHLFVDSAHIVCGQHLLQPEAQLQELKRCDTCDTFEEFCFTQGLQGEETIEIGRGRLTAALFPDAFFHHLTRLLASSTSPGEILPLFEEAAKLVVKDLPYASRTIQGEGESFEFVDEACDGAPVHVGTVLSLGGLIAVCQNFPQEIKQRVKDLETDFSNEYCIVQHDLTGTYLRRRVVTEAFDDRLLDNGIGVLGVEVTSEGVLVENMRDDGSYYSGALKDFSYPFELDINGDSEALDKQCARRLFGHLKGAEFLVEKGYGLKCSPLLAITLAIATQRKKLALKWSRTRGHMEVENWECSELEKVKWQILYTDKINQLGVDVEWGMEQVMAYEPSSSQSIGASNHSEVQALAAVFGNAVQQKRALGLQLSLPGGVGIGGSIEIYGSNGKELAKGAHRGILELLHREANQFVETSDLGQHARVGDDLLQGRLPHSPYSYLVVWDDAYNGHVSVYWVQGEDKLEWITDILIPGGKGNSKILFKGKLEGLRMKVKRDCSKLVSSNVRKPKSDLFSRFKKHKQLDIDSSMKKVPAGTQSNDEWVHLIGPQAKYSDTNANKYLWEATYMRAIISSRTSYSSGAMLETFVLGNKCGKIGHCKRHELDAPLVHQRDKVVAWGQFSKAPTSLVSNLIKWGGLIDENDLC